MPPGVPAKATSEQPTAPVAPQQAWQPVAEAGLRSRIGPHTQALWEAPMRVPAGVPPRAVPDGLQAAGGQDDFGYTWDDSGAFTWIDAVAGIDTGLSQAPRGAAVSGAIDIGFPFKFYENTYSALVVSTAGAIGFDGANLGGRTGTSSVPGADTPDNFIAPYLAPLWVNTGSYTGRVYYLRGGSAPGRYIAVEWRQVRDDLNGQFTFEVILFENGDIAFSYQSMAHGNGYYCSTTAAIEDAHGSDGLAYRAAGCNHMDSATGKTVRFTRPAAAPRVGIYPAHQGRFTQAAATEVFQFTVRNTGEFGTDTYDLIPTSSSWLTRLYAADGATALSDTDGDGIIDTGPINQRGDVTIVAKIQTPSSAQVGDHSSTAITARSSRDTGKSRTGQLHTAIPAPFAQAYGDYSDNAMSLYLAQPSGQATRKVTDNGYYGNYHAVAELPGKGFVYAWRVSRCLDNACSNYGSEIFYALLDPKGTLLRPATKLADHSNAATSAYDTEPAVAVTPDGRIGLLWQRYRWNRNDATYNYNLYFAVLDAAGNALVAPISITNNDAWGVWNALNLPFFYSPRIAATGNNRFVLAWMRQHRETGGDIQNIYYAVMNSGGSQVKSPAQLTGVGASAAAPTRVSPAALARPFLSPVPPPVAAKHTQPALASLSGNRAILTWERQQDGNDDVLFAVLGSDGSVVQGITDLSQDESVVDWNNWDVVQLSDGNILAAWEAWGCFPGEWVPRIRYAVLDASFNRSVAPRCLERAAPADAGERYVSLTADAAGHGILTWLDNLSNYKPLLYYALVESDGDVATPAMIFHTSRAIPPNLLTSYHGYGSTSYSWMAPAGVDGYVTAAASGSASIGGYGKVIIAYGNNGAQTASDVLLEATLPSGLSYDADTSGVTPTLNGQRVRWRLPNLALLGQGQLALYLRVEADTAAGANLPVAFSLTSNDPDTNPADNSAGTALVAAPPPGGPDKYGYIWDDGAPLGWVDATKGVDTGMTGDTWGTRVGPIALPFPFKYYESTYAEVYLAGSGYIGFTDAGSWAAQSRIPSAGLPNNVIASYWTPLTLAANGPAGRVYYTSGGSAPRRFFAAEWYRVNRDGQTYTFEVILHENGDIVFQYQDMGSVSYCGAAGIEDASGLDGLKTVDFCAQPPAFRSVRFFRPAPAAHVKVVPAYQGQFAAAGQIVTYRIPIRNAGELGADTYDLTATSAWPLALYRADGVTPLADTDADGKIDAGSLAQGAAAAVFAKVTVPQGASLGESNVLTITATSSLDSTEVGMITLQAAIPAPFAQGYRDTTDGALSLDLVRPVGQVTTQLTPSASASDLAAAELPGGGFVYVWSIARSENNSSVRELEYALLDRSGNTVRAPSKLTNHSGATLSTHDYPVVTVAPDGRIGVLWYRYMYNGSTGQTNYDIHFGVVDSTGNLVVAPTSLTNNTTWGSGGDLNYLRFYSPRIAATDDNRFVLSWAREHRESAGYVDDIYYAVRDTAGNQVRPITRLTSDTAGDEDRFAGPTLSGLTGQRVLVAYQRGGNYGDIYFAVLDSSGAVVKAPANLIEDGSDQWDWGPDAVQLSDGKIIIAWSGGDYPAHKTRFAVLDASYRRVVAPTDLTHPAAYGGSGYVSIAADNDGHGILTWMDYDSSYRSNLYYALVDGSGRTLTPPMIFRTSQAVAPRVETSFTGDGNTSYTRLPLPSARGYLPLLLRQPAAPSRPDVPTLNSITLPEDSPTSVVRWSAVAAAESYVLERATSPGFEDAVQVYAGPATEQVAVSAGIATFRYRVKARNAWGESRWSNVQAVEVRWEFEPNSEAVDATGPMQPGLRYYGMLASTADQKDYFYFDSTSPGIVELWLTEMTPGQDFNLVLRDAGLVMCGYSGNMGNADEHIMTNEPLPAGRYYIQVHRVAGDEAEPYHLYGAW
jgi:hypothetical protein